MSNPSKQKGNGYERELVKQAIQSGVTAKRAWASNGESLGLHSEVDVLVGGFKIQAKRRRAIAQFLKPSENVDAVAVREDRGQTLIVMTWWDFLDLVKLGG